MAEGEIAQAVDKSKDRFQDIAFKIFALVGFVSSVITVISWFTASYASLSAVIEEKTIEVPQAIQLSRFTDEKYTLSNSLEEISKRLCDPVEVSYDGTKTRNFNYNQATCNKQTALFDVLKRISSMDGKALVAYDVRVTNDGSQVADNIKIRSPIDVTASATDVDGGVIKVTQIQEGKLFSIPGLNPREVINIRLVSSTPKPESYEKGLGYPQVTFAGGKANRQTYTYVNGRYADIVKFLQDMPAILQVLFILGGAFLLTILWVLPISLLANAAETRKKPKAGIEPTV